jgi:hypothetical protein
MYAIQKVCLVSALRSLQTAEYLLDGLIFARPYLPFAGFSLLGGFIIGVILTRV